ncbi:hypothetical protein Scep_021265 [Stephania cephalantha]|uniref:Uncharacterized protein n=1 Tax=Stephania cephalantha TaxID=152367 RepID=A0AAP0F342_9MAGN
MGLKQSHRIWREGPPKPLSKFITYVHVSAISALSDEHIYELQLQRDQYRQIRECLAMCMASTGKSQKGNRGLLIIGSYVYVFIVYSSNVCLFF